MSAMWAMSEVMRDMVFMNRVSRIVASSTHSYYRFVTTELRV